MARPTGRGSLEWHTSVDSPLALTCRDGLGCFATHGGCMAGESARRKYESIRDQRRETLRSGRLVLLAIAAVVSGIAAIVAHQILGAWWLGAMIGLLPVFNLLLPDQREVAWRKGAEGEEAVGRALDLLAPTARTLHDRLIPQSRANIDHILVGPTGVWTVDAKNYTGEIAVRGRGSELWINGRNRSKLLAQAQRQRDVVQRVLAAGGLGHVPVRPALCFLGVEWPLLFRPESADGVVLVSPRRLRSLLQGDLTLTAADVQRVTQVIDQALRTAGTGNTPKEAKTPAAPRSDPPPRPTELAAEPNRSMATTVNRWTRYGKDRLYVNASDGQALGYVDLETNEVVPVDKRYRVVVAQAAANYLREA